MATWVCPNFRFMRPLSHSRGIILAIVWRFESHTFLQVPIKQPTCDLPHNWIKRPHADLGVSHFPIHAMTFSLSRGNTCYRSEI